MFKPVFWIRIQFNSGPAKNIKADPYPEDPVAIFLAMSENSL